MLVMAKLRKKQKSSFVLIIGHLYSRLSIYESICRSESLGFYSDSGNAG